MRTISIIILIAVTMWVYPAISGNIINEIGKKPDPPTTVGKMYTGQIGYVVPWAVKDGNINTTYSVFFKPTGTVQLRVKCVSPGKYEVDWTSYTSKENYHAN